MPTTDFCRRSVLVRGLLHCLGPLLPFIVPGCSLFEDPLPDLGDLYNRSAQYHDEHRNPVIVIPGILGTRLVHDNADGSRTIIWGAFGSTAANPHVPEEARLIGIPMAVDEPLRNLKDDVEPDGVLDRLEISLLGLPLELKAYVHILRSLGVGGYRDEEIGTAGSIDYGTDHFTCFQFPYDWRRDNAESAAELHRFIVQKKEQVRADIKERFGVDKPLEEIKFDIICHSMGGLVTRYFLRYGSAPLEEGTPPRVTWEGAKHVDRVVFVATPNAGSAHAIVQLAEGIRFAPIFHKHEAALLGTFPAIYQLFPRARHGPLVKASSDPEERLDPFDAALWQRLGWGLADPDQDWVLQMLLPGVSTVEERRRIALDHQTKCLRLARLFTEALDRREERPDGLRYYMVVGDAIATGAVLSANEDGELEFVTHAPGDATVLRSSALLDERVGGEWTYHLVSPIDWDQVQFQFSDHLGITKDPRFTDNLLYILLEDPR